MAAELILLPVVAQVFLVLCIFILLGARKAAAVKAGLVDRRQAALDNRAWPEAVLKVSNNIINQFETPVLFYVLCLVLYAADAVTVVTLSLAWAYFASRVLHAFIHTGSNYVPWRFRVFILGTLILLALTVLAALALL